MRRSIYTFTIKVSFISFFTFLCSCQQEWLDVKQDQSQVIPNSLNDLKAMLDNSSVLNVRMPFLNHISSDDLEAPENILNTVIPEHRNAYLWHADIYEGASTYNWNELYRMVYYANLILESLEDIPLRPENTPDHNYVQGGALFIRSWAFFHLVQLFSVQYEEQREQELGIPLLLSADINQQYNRGTIGEVYRQIIQDLHLATDLLPAVQMQKTRASKAAAHALLARTYLQMGRYAESLAQAEAGLNYGSDLLDFNMLDATKAFPISPFNEEVIFESYMVTTGLSLPSSVNVSKELYDLYDENDLRKQIFFQLNDDRIIFKGSYEGANRNFAGISVNELYLIRAECLARLNRMEEGADVLNQLLKWRYVHFTPLNLSSAAHLLTSILQERRKELLYRGLRWFDLKRLNLDEPYQTTLTRTVGGEVYVLQPQDGRYVFPIPDEVIEMSGIQQNPR